jgi:hypothetical protein
VAQFDLYANLDCPTAPEHFAHSFCPGDLHAWLQHIELDGPLRPLADIYAVRQRRPEACAQLR